MSCSLLESVRGLLERTYRIDSGLAEVAPFVEQYRRTILPELFDEERFVPFQEFGDTA